MICPDIPVMIGVWVIFEVQIAWRGFIEAAIDRVNIMFDIQRILLVSL